MRAIKIDAHVRRPFRDENGNAFYDTIPVMMYGKLAEVFEISYRTNSEEQHLITGRLQCCECCGVGLIPENFQVL